MFKKLLEKIVLRRAAQHGSFLALAIGMAANLLGIPLPPESINILVSAISVIVYIISQFRAPEQK